MPTKNYKTLFDLAARIYIAYFLLDYGVAKLTGTMFNNATPQILQTNLKDVDMFYLTWYWFQKNTVASWIIGVLQVAAAILLLFNRTVIIGCIIAIPVFAGVLYIDIFCVSTQQLSVRVFYYICLLLMFCYFRKQQIIQAFKTLTTNMAISIPLPTAKKIAYVLLFLFVCLFVELMLLLIVNLIYYYQR